MNEVDSVILVTYVTFLICCHSVCCNLGPHCFLPLQHPLLGLASQSRNHHCGLRLNKHYLLEEDLSVEHVECMEFELDHQVASGESHSESWCSKLTSG
jgi:hypothetical protein